MAGVAGSSHPLVKGFALGHVVIDGDEALEPCVKVDGSWYDYPPAS